MQRILLKVGGETLLQAEDRARLAADLAALAVPGPTSAQTAKQHHMALAV